MSRIAIAMSILISTAIGIGLGVGVALNFDDGHDASETTIEKQPLYWVAPMDPNYRRSQPGKSPMGMDLIPVYDNDGSESELGAVRISPDVINNLGVRTGLVEYGPLHSEIRTVGYLQYNQDALVHINPRIAGWVEALNVKAVGDRVEKGQLLYQLYSPELVNAQQELLMAVSQNNPQFIRAAEERLRTWQIPDSFIAEVRTEGKVRQNVAYYAPKSGYLTALNVRRGEFVQPGQVLMAIGTLDDIWVEAQVFARQVHLLEVGLPVVIASDYLPGQVRQGRVDYVYPSIDPMTRTQPIRVVIDNPNGTLKPGMFADLTINLTSEQATTLVPKEAVIRTGSMDRVVLALGEGAFKSVAVTLGRSGEKHIEVIEGVEAGERVVTSAQFLLDSESSKNSDFVCLHHDQRPTDGTGGVPASNTMNEMNDAEAGEATVTVDATVNTIMADHNMVNVSHEPVDAWDWPAMTMNFDVAETVDLHRFEPGARVRLVLQKLGENRYQISAAERLSSKSRQPEDSDGKKHDHKTHGEMEAQP